MINLRVWKNKCIFSRLLKLRKEQGAWWTLIHLPYTCFKMELIVMLSLILLLLTQERSLCEFLSPAWIWLVLYLTKELMSKWSPKTKIKRDFSYNLSSLRSFKLMVRRRFASVNALSALNSTVNAWKMVKSSVGHTAVVLGAKMFQVTQKEKVLYFCSDREINCSRLQ